MWWIRRFSPIRPASTISALGNITASGVNVRRPGEPTPDFHALLAGDPELQLAAAGRIYEGFRRREYEPGVGPGEGGAREMRRDADQTGSPEFKKWFGGSKVVAPDGSEMYGRFVYREILLPGQSIALPMLGCGLGGLRWEDVRPVVVDAFGGFETVDGWLYEVNDG